MPAERLKLKLLKDWNGRRKGTVLELVPRGQATVMVKNKIAKRVRTRRKTDK